MLVTQETLETVTRCLASTNKPVVIDTETSWSTRYEDRWLLGISLYTNGESFYIPVGHQANHGIPANNVTVPSTLLMGIGTELIFHNALFDLIVLDRAGIQVPDIKIYDTMLMSHLIWEGDDPDNKLPQDLSAVGRRYVGRASVKETELKGYIKKWGWEKIPPSIMAIYAEQDAKIPYDVYFTLKPMFAEFEEYWVREFEITKIIKKMVMKGLPVDMPEIIRLETWCEDKLQQVLKDLSFDPGKAEAKTKLFADPPYGLGLKPLSYTPKTHEPQINKKFVDQLQHPIAGLLKEHSATKKQLTAYYSAYRKRTSDDSARIHAGFKQHGTVSGRWSCEDPNLQQIPRVSPIKKLFLPESGKQLWEIDYSNIEWRMGALYSQETELIEAFKNGLDMHQITAEALGVSRQDAKIGGFTWLFMGGEDAIVEQIGAERAKAKAFIKGMNNKWEKVADMKQTAWHTARDNGQINIWTGRKRHYRNPRYSYTAFNFLTQGGSFEIVKSSLIECDKAGVDVRNCVHDSIWCMVDESSAKKDVDEICHIMEDWTESTFGLKFTVEAKRLN